MVRAFGSSANDIPTSTNLRVRYTVSVAAHQFRRGQTCHSTLIMSVRALGMGLNHQPMRSIRCLEQARYMHCIYSPSTLSEKPRLVHLGRHQWPFDIHTPL